MSIQIDKGGAMSAEHAANHASFTAAQTRSECRPEPLMRERPDPKPLPVDHIAPLPAPVEAIAELTSAPIEIAFQSVMAAVSLAVQHISDTETLAGPAPLSLFLLTVAASGGRKSSCD